MVGRVKHGEATVEDVGDIAQSDQRRAHLAIGVLDVHALGHCTFDLGFGQQAVLQVTGIVAGQVERQRLATLVEHVGMALPAVAVDHALADNADVLECLVLAWVTRQGVDQRGRAHGGGVRVLDVALAWIVLGALGAQQRRALGDFQGHVAFEVQRAALVGAGG
ncbi:hypothetical protein D3C80_1164160 [compost metagenome]